METITATLALSRWREHVPFVIPLTILGSLLGSQQQHIDLNWKIAVVLAANILAVAYAFMINDIEDAKDDARDPQRAKRNVISSGRMGHKSGYFACQITAIASLSLYAYCGWIVFVLGTFTLLLSHFYSSYPLRLKAWPVTDVLSHSLMLSTLLLLTGFFAYSSHPRAIWWIITAATFFSIYGQLYNQLRDYKLDKMAGLKNTAILLGKKNTYHLMYFSIAIAATCLAAGVIARLFPWWFVMVTFIIIPISHLWHKKTDFRGSGYFEQTGQYQNQALVTFNILTFFWLLQVLIA